MNILAFSQGFARRTGTVLASIATAAALMVTPTAQAENAQSPALPTNLVRPAVVTKQIREDSSKNPIIWAGSALDVPGLNSGFRTVLERNGMSFYEWSPLMTSIQDPTMAIFDYIDKYTPSFGAYVDTVMKKTGAKKVNIVTFSQGGLITAAWMRQGENAQKVDKVANISGVMNGSPLAKLGPLVPGNCLGIGTCQNLNPDNEFIKRTTNPIALPGIEYLNIDSRIDVVAGPYTNSLMSGSGDYQNVLTEDLCPGQFSGHGTMSFMPVVQESIVQFFRGQTVAPKCSIL